MVSGLDSIALAVAHLERGGVSRQCVSGTEAGGKTGAASSSTEAISKPSINTSSARIVSVDGAGDLARSNGCVESAGSGLSSSGIVVLSSRVREDERKLRATDNASPNSCVDRFSAPERMYSSSTPESAGSQNLPSTTAPEISNVASPGEAQNVPSRSHRQSSGSGDRNTSVEDKSAAEENTAEGKGLRAACGKRLKNLESVFEPADFQSNGPRAPDPKDIFDSVEDDDVLCGRGGETNHHPGNIQYRRLVKACQPAYLAAKRRDKPRIAAGIVLAVRKVGGRFLKKEATSNMWRDVGNTRAREKTSQALREGAPELRHASEGAAASAQPDSSRMPPKVPSPHLVPPASFHQIRHHTQLHHHVPLPTAPHSRPLMVGSHPVGGHLHHHHHHHHHHPSSKGPILVPVGGPPSILLPKTNVNVGGMINSRAIMVQHPHAHLHQSNGNAFGVDSLSHLPHSAVRPSQSSSEQDNPGATQHPTNKRMKGLDGLARVTGDTANANGTVAHGFVVPFTAESSVAPATTRDSTKANNCVATVSGDDDDSSSSSSSGSRPQQETRTSGPRLKNFLKRRLEEKS